MIRTGVVRNAVVIGVELISRYMDWSNRSVAVLFGDGAAAGVLQATEREEGVLATEPCSSWSMKSGHRRIRMAVHQRGCKRLPLPISRSQLEIGDRPRFPKRALTSEPWSVPHC